MCREMFEINLLHCKLILAYLFNFYNDYVLFVCIDQGPELQCLLKVKSDLSIGFSGCYK